MFDDVLVWQTTRSACFGLRTFHHNPQTHIVYHTCSSSELSTSALTAAAASAGAADAVGPSAEDADAVDGVRDNVSEMVCWMGAS